MSNGPLRRVLLTAMLALAAAPSAASNRRGPAERAPARSAPARVDLRVELNGSIGSASRDVVMTERVWTPGQPTGLVAPQAAPLVEQAAPAVAQLSAAPAAASTAALDEAAARPGRLQRAAAKISSLWRREGAAAFASGKDDSLIPGAAAAMGILGQGSHGPLAKNGAEQGTAAPKKDLPAPVNEPAPPKQDLKFNQSERAYITGQAIFLAALALQAAALTMFVASLPGASIADTGTAVMVQRFALAFASVFAAGWVARTPMVKVLRLTGWARAGVFMASSALALSGLLPFWGFALLLGINGFLIAANTLVDLDENGANMVFENGAKAEKAVYLYDNIAHILAVAIPFIAGSLMGYYGLQGPVAAQVILGMMGVVLAVATIFYEKVKPLTEPRKLALSTWETFKRVAKSTRENDITKGVIWIRTFERAIEEAIFNVILPLYGALVLLPMAMVQPWLVTATEIGGWVATGVLVVYARKIKDKIGTQKFLALVTAMAAATFIPSLVLWTFHPTLSTALIVAFGMKILYQPLRSESSVQLQKALREDPNLKGYGPETFSVLRILIMLGAGAGAGIFSYVTKLFPEASLIPFMIVSAALILQALVYWQGYRWIRRGVAKLEAAQAAEPIKAS